jgi:alpha-D-ribose 1-methylphosphonate 5-triphosphate diphosphatase PhnM
MTPSDWAALAVSITTLVGALAIGVRHLVKHYLSELRPMVAQVSEIPLID